MYTNVDIISAMSEYQDKYLSINNLPLISSSYLVFFKLYLNFITKECWIVVTFLDDIIFLRKKVFIEIKEKNIHNLKMRF